MVEHLTPIREKLISLLDDELYLMEVLKSGAEKATEISGKTVDEVKYKLGLQFQINTKHKKVINN